MAEALLQCTALGPEKLPDNTAGLHKFKYPFKPDIVLLQPSNSAAIPFTHSAILSDLETHNI